MHGGSARNARKQVIEDAQGAVERTAGLPSRSYSSISCDSNRAIRRQCRRRITFRTAGALLQALQSLYRLSRTLPLNADFKIPQTSYASFPEDMIMRNIENMTSDPHLSKKLGISLYRFKSIVAEAMGEIDTAVIFQNNVVTYPKN